MTHKKTALVGTLSAVVIMSVFLAQIFVREKQVDWTGKTEVTVVLSEAGFTPREMYITKGTKVTFVTELKKQFWPASDLHPSHSIYSQFDPRKPISVGDEWSFVFDKKGRWSYHDHLEATVTGVITVVPVGYKANERLDALDACDQAAKDAKRACWSERLQRTMDAKGLDAAFDELGRLNRSDPEFSKQCHNFAHDLGLRAYGKYGDTAPFSLKVGYCNDGFWHGFMEGFFTKHNDAYAAQVFCDAIQKQFNTTYPLAYQQCIHGIGHGGAEYALHTRADLWGDIPKLTTEFTSLCVWMREADKKNCAGGAYAALADWMHLQERYARIITPSGLFSLCAKAEYSWAQRGCAWEYSKRMDWFVKDTRDIFPILQKESPAIEEGRYLPSMIESAAIIIGKRGQVVDDTKLAEQCSTLQESFRVSCFVGIVQGLFFSAAPGEEARRASRFCLSEALAESEKSVCASTLLSVVSNSYQAARLQDACDLFPETITRDAPACARSK